MRLVLHPSAREGEKRAQAIQTSIATKQCVQYYTQESWGFASVRKVAMLSELRAHPDDRPQGYAMAAYNRCRLHAITVHGIRALVVGNYRHQAHDPLRSPTEPMT